jgi:hypothetical protein
MLLPFRRKVPTFTSFIKDKKSSRSHKTVEIKVFLHFFACLGKDPEPDCERMRIQEAEKHTDPTYADPEHCKKGRFLPFY